ncbi:sensor histidine kinase [Pedobacter petrophilus]|uniref:sensor histidine kinase n=1 Tax=Pedobacter petrophilus TaxID=1908241 RepID=UPI00363852CF
METGTKDSISLAGHSEMFSRELLNAIPQQIWTTDEQGILNNVNDQVSRDLGIENQVIISAGWSIFMHPDDLSHSLANWNESLETGHEYVNEVRLRFADGYYYWHLIRAKRILHNQGYIWVGSNTNINEQKANESRKDEFISIASHELKTPLTAIKGFTQMLSRQISETKASSFLHRITSQLERLEKLIADLMDVSKINAGKMAFNLAEFDFSKMLRETVAGLQQVYPKYQLILQDQAPIHFKGDQFRLEQVVQNFVANAVKYSPDADLVLIKATLEQDYLIVSVTDYGIGIKPEHLSKLFDRYYRADNSSARFEGLGLGLYISADIIKRHGGSFWIESEQGKGSTFHFKLPLSVGQTILPEVKIPDRYKDKYISIKCNNENGIMHVEWYGHQDMHSVKHGGKLMIEYLRNNRCSKVFNDNRAVLGTWSEASDWAANVWLPLMELAGLRHFAWVFSASAFSQLSAKKSVENEEATSDVRFFANAENAWQWLHALSPKKS